MKYILQLTVSSTQMSSRITSYIDKGIGSVGIPVTLLMILFEVSPTETEEGAGLLLLNLMTLRT